MPAPPQLAPTPTVDIAFDGAANTPRLRARLTYGLNQTTDGLFVRVVAECQRRAPRGVRVQAEGDELRLEVTGDDHRVLADAAGEAVRWLVVGIGDEAPAFDWITREWLHRLSELEAARVAVDDEIRRATA